MLSTGDPFDSWLSETASSIARFNFRVCIVAEPDEKGGCKVTCVQYFTYPSAFIPYPFIPDRWVGLEYFYMSAQMSTLIPGAEAFAALQEEVRRKTLDQQAFSGVGWQTAVIEEDDSIYKAAFHDPAALSRYSLSGSEFSSKTTSSNAGSRVAASSRIRQSTRVRADRVARKRVQGISTRIVKNHHLASKRSAKSGDRVVGSSLLPVFGDGRVSNSSVQQSSYGKDKVGLLHHAMNKKVLGKQSSYSSVSLSSQGRQHQRRWCLFAIRLDACLITLSPFSIPDRKYSQEAKSQQPQGGGWH